MQEEEMVLGFIHARVNPISSKGICLKKFYGER